jgi:AhpD family alkylhydroperoxidase
MPCWYGVIGGRLVDAELRERLMLVVTAVNDCRYCSYVHTRAALCAGISEGEVEELSRGELEGSPPEQVPALVYAQHWAESGGRPDPEARARVVERYGERRVRAIEVVLHAIRIGNLTGNTFDRVLSRASGGRPG